MDWSSLPGLDDEGFCTVERLRLVAGRSPEELAQLYPTAALLIEPLLPKGPAGAPQVEDRERSFARTMQGEAVAAPEVFSEAGRYVGRVAFLAKRPRGLFPDMITVGRALNSDITFVLSSVSKVHGYFRRDEGVWSFTDQRATNGTLVNGERLEAGARAALRDGDRLQFGGEIACTFVLPGSLARAVLGG